jgi:hypothetical protein
MTLWHASTELRLTTADAVAAKMVRLAAGYAGRLEKHLGLEMSAKLSAELDTSG